MSRSWQAFDHRVPAQTAELISDGAGPEGLRIAEFGKMAGQVGAAKADWQQAEEARAVFGGDLQPYL